MYRKQNRTPIKRMQMKGGYHTHFLDAEVVQGYYLSKASRDKRLVMDL